MFYDVLCLKSILVWFPFVGAYLQSFSGYFWCGINVVLLSGSATAGVWHLDGLLDCVVEWMKREDLQRVHSQVKTQRSTGSSPQDGSKLSKNNLKQLFLQVQPAVPKIVSSKLILV